MSGGHFDYKQYELDEIADKLDTLIEQRNEEYFNFSNKTISDMNRVANSLRLAAVYLQRIDWLVSGDDSEASYEKRLKDDIENFRIGRELRISNQILKSLVGENNIDEWWNSANKAFSMTPKEMWKKEPSKVKQYLLNQIGK